MMRDSTFFRIRVEAHADRQRFSPTLDRVYEALKLKWQQANPAATAEQYEAAIKELADTLGI